MKKVSIITFHGAHNYGSVLQAYALQKIVTNLGYDCEIINFRTSKQIEVYSVLTKRKGLKYRFKNLYYRFNIKNRKAKHAKFEKFILESYKLNDRPYNSIEELKENPPIYDFYISGSDQIWNLAPADADEAYFLTFVQNGKKISYAPSFGPIGNVTEDNKVKMADWINDYDFLSVREFSGVQMIKEITGRDVPVLIDPTMLLEKIEWDILADKAEKSNKLKEYIFFYTTFANREMIKIVNYVSKKLNLPVITPYVSNQYDMTTKYTKATDCGPYEFLEYIRGAKLILSSSFHGCVFSIIFHKAFYAINGIKDMRLNTLLSKLSLLDRSIEVDNLERKIVNAFKIDFKTSADVIKAEQEKSINYLKDAFNSFNIKK